MNSVWPSFMTSDFSSSPLKLALTSRKPASAFMRTAVETLFCAPYKGMTEVPDSNAMTGAFPVEKN